MTFGRHTLKLWLEQQTGIVGFNTVDSEVRMWTRSITTRMLFLATALQNIPQCSFVLYICSILGLPNFRISPWAIHTFILSAVKFLEYLNFINFINRSLKIKHFSPRGSSHRSTNHDSSQYAFYCSFINRLFSMPQTLNTHKKNQCCFLALIRCTNFLKPLKHRVCCILSPLLTLKKPLHFIHRIFIYLFWCSP